MFSDKQTIMQTKLMFQIFKEFHERQEQEIRERPVGGVEMRLSSRRPLDLGLQVEYQYEIQEEEVIQESLKRRRRAWALAAGGSRRRRAQPSHRATGVTTLARASFTPWIRV